MSIYLFLISERISSNPMLLFNCYVADAGLELFLLPLLPRALIIGVRQTTLSENIYAYILEVVLDLFHVYRAPGSAWYPWR